VVDAFRLPFVQRGLVEIAILAVAAGVVGTWIVLRGLAFYSHAVATAAFPGLVVAAGVGIPPPLGAFAAALAFTGAMAGLARRRSSDYDAITAIALVGALVVGVILASDVFHSGANVDSLLFGSLLVIGPRDVWISALAAAAALGSTIVLGPTWLATGFGPSEGSGRRVRRGVAEAALFALVALVVTASLAATGALLATAIVVVPAATTRLWARRMTRWQVHTVALLAVEGLVGLWLSVEMNAPPGPVIAVVGGAVFAVVLAGRTLARRRRPHPRGGRTAEAALAGVLLLAGCSRGAVAGGTGHSIDVVATTTQIADWVRNVGGSAVTVHGVLHPNTDPHEYEPRPGDVEATAGAAVVFENGDGLDAWMAKVVQEAGGHPLVVDLGAAVPVRLPGEATGPEASRFDPHWWHDPLNAEAAVARIRDVLARADPRARATIERSAAAYLGKLRALDTGIRACFTAVPASQRKLVTDHDAFGYFARRYGIDVVGAVIPSQTTQAEPSAGQVADLIALIRRERVRAIFPESSLSPKLVQSIARATGASANSTLYGDTLGRAGSAGATYLSMEGANADAMVRGFTGGAQSCSIGGMG
jgi:zinc/manganese transport system substrate-binding protein